MNRNKQVIRIGIGGFTAIFFVLLSLAGNAENKTHPEDELSQVDMPEFAISRRYETIKPVKDTVPAFTDVFSDASDISKYEKVYSSVEKMPQFPGGESALMSFITMNLHYPPIDGCGNPGKVIIRFIITKYGDVSHIEVIRSFDPAYDKEAITVIKKLPRWIPGEHNGKKAAVYYTIPIAFRLQ